MTDTEPRTRYSAYVDGRLCHNCGLEPYRHECPSEARATPGLDAAWAEAEAALPKRWRLAISPYYPSGWEAWAYNIHETPTSALGPHSSGACYGDTPAAALRALAARLAERSPEEDERAP